MLPVINCIALMASSAIKLPILQPIKMSEMAKVTVFFVVKVSRLLKMYGKHHEPGILDKNRPATSNQKLEPLIAISKFDVIKQTMPK